MTALPIVEEIRRRKELAREQIPMMVQLDIDRFVAADLMKVIPNLKQTPFIRRWRENLEGDLRRWQRALEREHGDTSL